MPARSALQKTKEREALRDVSVMETLRKRSIEAEARRESLIVDPAVIGADLEKRFSDFVVRKASDFSRPLKTRNERSIRLAYAQFMFGDYPVPQYIIDSFLSYLQVGPSTFAGQHETLGRDLYLNMRSGRSVWKNVTREFLSKKETHSLTNIRSSFSVREALIYAIAVQDCDNGLAHKIAKSRMSDLYNRGSDFSREVIRFFARNPCSNRDMNDILDFLRTRNPREYSLKGRTITTLMRAHEEWVREAARAKEMGDYTWEGINVSDLKFVTREGKYEWHCFQLKNSHDLGLEGTKQRHCVSSYRPMCSSGSIGIFTLRRRDRTRFEIEMPYERALTIEVTKQGVIRQVRGFANRDPEDHEKEAVHYWAAQNGMNYNERRVY